MSMTATFTSKLVLIVLSSLLLTGVAKAQGKSVVNKEFKEISLKGKKLLLMELCQI